LNAAERQKLCAAMAMAAHRADQERRKRILAEPVAASS
jgi:hypothetical protein